MYLLRMGAFGSIQSMINGLRNNESIRSRKANLRNTGGLKGMQLSQKKVEPGRVDPAERADYGRIGICTQKRAKSPVIYSCRVCIVYGTSVGCIPCRLKKLIIFTGITKTHNSEMKHLILLAFFFVSALISLRAQKAQTLEVKKSI